MSKVRAMLDSLGVAGDTSIAYPDTFIDDIGTAYDEDMGISNAAVEVARAELAEAQAEILRLKSVNYDLIMGNRAEGSANSADDDGEAPEENDNHNDDDDGPTGVDRIFAEKKEEKDD